jgi:threonine dehydrogenase-like Zn-dependent dehydrogenase
MEKLCGMIESGEINQLKMVSHRVTIDELDQVYYKFEKKNDDMQKVSIGTKFSAPPCASSPSLKRYSK